MVGIVIIEDVIEEIFGEIEDEYDDEEWIEEKIFDGVFCFFGCVEIDYINKMFGFSFFELENYDMFGGFIIYQLEIILEVGVVVEFE